MSKIFKVVIIVIGIIVLVAAVALIYISAAFPKTAPPVDVTIDSSQQRIQRGRYLSNHVSGCVGCHSVRDWTKFAAPVKPGTEGGGGDRIDESNGFPGTVVVKNITPGALADWSDGELIRAIACGVTKENKALFPIMPYPDYNNLSREDLYSIIAYIKTLDPIENNFPETELNFPLNFIVKTLPLESYIPGEPVSESDIVEYGKYLTTAASCFNCHTQMHRGTYLEGMDFAGGRGFKIAGGVVRSTNITPDIETGIGAWTKETFINRFKYFDPDSNRNIPVGPNDFNTPMPWTMYAGMTEKDLAAIFEYLKTIRPVNNSVARWTPDNATSN